MLQNARHVTLAVLPLIFITGIFVAVSGRAASCLSLAVFHRALKYSAAYDTIALRIARYLTIGYFLYFYQGLKL